MTSGVYRSIGGDGGGMEVGRFYCDYFCQDDIFNYFGNLTIGNLTRHLIIINFENGFFKLLMQKSGKSWVIWLTCCTSCGSNLDDYFFQTDFSFCSGLLK